MTAFGEAVPLTVLLGIVVMTVGLAVYLSLMTVGYVIKKLTGRPNMITRWDEH